MQPRSSHQGRSGRRPRLLPLLRLEPARAVFVIAARAAFITAITTAGNVFVTAITTTRIFFVTAACVRG